MAETRRRFDPHFRQGAVRIVRETGKSIAQVAHDLRINDGTLATPVKNDRAQQGEAVAGQPSQDKWPEVSGMCDPVFDAVVAQGRWWFEPRLRRDVD